MTGTSTLMNSGTIQQTGTGRAIDSNSGVANLTVTNTGLISSVSSDAFRVNTDSVVFLITAARSRSQTAVSDRLGRHHVEEQSAGQPRGRAHHGGR